MTFRRALPRLVVITMGIVVCVAAAAHVYERVQLKRAQKLINALRNAASRGQDWEAEIEPYITARSCASERCTQVYEVVNWPTRHENRWLWVEGFLYHYWPRWRYWTVSVRLGKQNGNQVSREVRVEHNNRQGWSSYTLYQSDFVVDDRCDVAEATLHLGYGVYRDARKAGLDVWLKPDASPAYLDRALDLDLSCLRSTEGCSHGDKLAPRVLGDLVADEQWREANRITAERIASDCEKSRPRVIIRSASPN